MLKQEVLQFNNEENNQSPNNSSALTTTLCTLCNSNLPDVKSLQQHMIVYHSAFDIKNFAQSLLQTESAKQDSNVSKEKGLTGSVHQVLERSEISKMERLLSQNPALMTLISNSPERPDKEKQLQELVQTLSQQIQLQQNIILHQMMALQQLSQKDNQTVRHWFDPKQLRPDSEVLNRFQMQFPTRKNIPTHGIAMDNSVNSAHKKIFKGINRSCRRDHRDPRRCRVHKTYHSNEALLSPNYLALQTNCSVPVRVAETSPSANKTEPQDEPIDLSANKKEEPQNLRIPSHSEQEVKFTCSRPVARGRSQIISGNGFVSIGLLCKPDYKEPHKCMIHRIRHRVRTRLTAQDLLYLHNMYRRTANPSRRLLAEISNHIGLPLRVIQVWFQNTRRLMKNTCACGKVYVTNKLFDEHLKECTSRAS